MRGLKNDGKIYLICWSLEKKKIGLFCMKNCMLWELNDKLLSISYVDYVCSILLMILMMYNFVFCMLVSMILILL